MDIVAPETRSRMMANIRGKGNRSTELKMASILRQSKIWGWRRHVPIFGKPDFVFRGHKLAVFVDGCFWHGCPCATIPKQNRKFWVNKIESNKKRDRKVVRHLKNNGWHVVRFRECTLDKEAKIITRLNRVLEE